MLQKFRFGLAAWLIAKYEGFLRGMMHQKMGSLEIGSGLGDSAWLLYGFVRSLRPQISVEIGSARGKSTCFIGMALKENGVGKLFAIDPHCRTAWNDKDGVDTYPLIVGNLRSLGLEDYVKIIREKSEVAARKWVSQIDLLFIDGDHSYDGVKHDWELYLPFVKQYGLVIFHDTLWDLHPEPPFYRPDMGVPRFVEELRRQGYPVITIDKNYGVSIVQPVKGGIILSGQ